MFYVYFIDNNIYHYLNLKDNCHKMILLSTTCFERIPVKLKNYMIFKLKLLTIRPGAGGGQYCPPNL